MHILCAHVTVFALALTAKENRATNRTVVLLRTSAKKKLEKLAAKENVSAGEIIRRSLNTYESIETRVRKEEEEKMMEEVLAILTCRLGEREPIARKHVQPVRRTPSATQP